jgi:nucleotide-binding universal stress UspA family protein
MSAYRRILAAVDGSEAGAAGLREALRLAKSEAAELCIVHVVNEAPGYSPLAGPPPPNLPRMMADAGRRVLEKAKDEADKAGVRAKTVLVEETDRGAAGGILSQAGKLDADLLVLGTHGRRGLARALLGSDAEHVVREAPVPVLLVRAGVR